MSEITKALVKFQRNCPAIIKDKKAEVVSKRTGGKFTYDYADLACIMSAVRPVLSECGLFLSQSFEDNGVTHLITKVMHEGGEHIESRLPLPVNGLAPQDAGSAITYYRRYAIVALLGLAAEDDDGKAAEDAGATHGNSALTKAFKDSVAIEQKKSDSPEGRDHLAAQQYVLDKEFTPYLKDTPSGKCWKVTAIQQAMRDFVHDLNGLSDYGDIKGFLADNKAALDACAVALPSWYYGKQGSDVPGIERRIGDKKQELSKPSADDPSRFLQA